MGKATKRKRSEWDRQAGETHLQWQSRVALMKQSERDSERPIVSKEAAQHGAYKDEFIHHAESGSKTQTKRNLKASPLAYWRAQGMLSPTQESAIDYCLHLWEFLPPLPRCTAAYGERIFGNADGFESEAAVNAFLDAKDDLVRICGGRDRHGEQVIGYIPAKYWRVFENCIRFDEPAGVAGSSLGYTGRTGNAKAHTVVCFVADIIAMKEQL